MKHRGFALALLGLVLAVAPAVQAQSAYPNKPVRLVVPYPAGQGADIFGRMIAERLSEKWGQQVVVENKGGGGGVPGTVSVKMSPPDGYTLMVGGSQAITVNPNLYSKMSYEPMKDFVAISGLYVAPLVWVVHPSSGITSLAQLVDTAKKQPGKLSVPLFQRGENLIPDFLRRLFAFLRHKYQAPFRVHAIVERGPRSNELEIEISSQLRDALDVD